MALSVCVLGLGLMGRRWPARLIAAGLTSQGLEPLTAAGGCAQGHSVCVPRWRRQPGSRCVLLMLADPQAVQEGTRQLKPHLDADQLDAGHGHVGPDQSKVYAARLASRGIGWVDAPVSGGPQAQRRAR